MKIQDIFNREEKKDKKTLDDFRKRDAEETQPIDKTEETKDDAKKVSDKNNMSSNDFFLQSGEIEPKWIKVCIKTWSAVMCFVWFLVSCLTYSPILFISDKIDSVVKNKKKSLLIAAIIHCFLLMLLIVWLFVQRSPTAE